MKRNTAWLVTGLLSAPLAVIESKMLDARFGTIGWLASIPVALGIGMLVGYLFRKSWPIDEKESE